jgi:cobalt-zinc-cadmium efflux system protein
MKTQRKILIAFILNLGFAIFEMQGGLFIGSVAILSDAIHDLGDSISIGIAFFLERKSRRPPDEGHTYGYLRYSVLGGLITTTILFIGSIAVIWGAVKRIFSPTPIHYDGMIVFAIIGVAVNIAAAFITREGDSINQKAVNLHMLEDVLGWVVVLVGAVVMRFTDLAILDPLMSVAVAAYILYHAAKNLLSALDLFLEKTPKGINIQELTAHILEIEGVSEIHHIHVRSLDGEHHCATMHIRCSGDSHPIKEAVRRELAEHGVGHATLELEGENEPCSSPGCDLHTAPAPHHGHHHHH